MIRSDLSRVVEIPVPCANCGEEGFHVVGWLVKQLDVKCPKCGTLLNLNTEEWAAFRNALKEFHVGKQAPIAPVKE